MSTVEASLISSPEVPLGIPQPETDRDLKRLPNELKRLLDSSRSDAFVPEAKFQKLPRKELLQEMTESDIREVLLIAKNQLPAGYEKRHARNGSGNGEKEKIVLTLLQESVATLVQDMESHLALRVTYGIPAEMTLKEFQEKEARKPAERLKCYEERTREVIEASIGSTDTSQWDGDTSHIHTIEVGR